MGIGMFALEWPLTFIAGTTFHRSLEARLALLPLTALAAVLLYQGTNPAIYYLTGSVVYFWAYSEGEVYLSRDFHHLQSQIEANSELDGLRQTMDTPAGAGGRSTRSRIGGTKDSV